MNTTVDQMGRPKKSEPTEPLRIPASVVKRIRRIALHRGEDPGDYIARRFTALIDADEKKMLEDIEKERRGAKE